MMSKYVQNVLSMEHVLMESVFALAAGLGPLVKVFLIINVYLIILYSF